MFGLPGILGTLADLGVVILGFGLIIFVHELGHFLAAKWARIRVLAFAIGFGPAACSYRKGMGIRRGSSEREYLGLLHAENDGVQTADVHAISPTEYRLNWLPIGGYVKMLGQDDMDPSAVSGAPDSYQSVPVWKRMVVISAGVVMNIITAALVFIAVFMVGLRVEPPVIGAVVQGGPAAGAVAINADALGVEQPGLMTGDVVTWMNDETPETFNDLIVGAAMSAPDEPVRLSVKRDGVDGILKFEILPQRSELTGLLDLGVGSAISTRVMDVKDGPRRAQWDEITARLGLSGIEPGMTLVQVNNTPVSSPLALGEAARASQGQPITALFRDLESGSEAAIQLTPRATLNVDLVPLTGAEAAIDHLLGLTPVMMVALQEGEDPIQGLQRGDIFARIGAVEFPSIDQGIREIRAHTNERLTLEVLRGSGPIESRERVTLDVEVGRDGRVGFPPGDTKEIGSLLATAPESVREPGGVPRSPAAASIIDRPGQRLLSVNGRPTPTLLDAREALLTSVPFGAQSANVTLQLESPSPDRPVREVVWTLDESAIARLHELSWSSGVPLELFEPERVLLKAEGPVDAVGKGARQTKRIMVSTYLTFARLAQGTVQIEHLKGPVGIAHLGTLIADRGFIWVVFFLGLISVNLAVINFLPLPIVDGGQFLMLCYEGLRGRPVPIPVQNAVTMVGLLLIGSMFLLVTFNDVKALLGV